MRITTAGEFMTSVTAGSHMGITTAGKFMAARQLDGHEGHTAGSGKQNNTGLL
jgi:hypothetical protein